MANPNDHIHTTNTVHETHTTERRSGGSMAFIVGGLVVAVAVIAWLLFAGTDVDGTGDDVNVTIDGSAAESVEGAAEQAGNAMENAADQAGAAAEQAGDAAAAEVNGN